MAVILFLINKVLQSTCEIFKDSRHKMWYPVSFILCNPRGKKSHSVCSSRAETEHALVIRFTGLPYFAVISKMKIPCVLSTKLQIHLAAAPWV